MSWAGLQADALDAQAAAIVEAIDALAPVHEILGRDGEGELCREIRSLCGWLKSKASTKADAALMLRAADRNGGVRSGDE